MPGGAPPPRRRRPLLRLAKWLLRWMTVAGLWGAGLALLALAWFAYDLPDVEQATRLPRAPSLTIEARDGSFLGAVGDLYGEPVQLADLPPYLPNAFIAIEDRRFRSHWGVDLTGIARALYVNVMSGELRQGGSTITQQVAKNLFLTHERTLHRKIQETLLALWLEYRFSKEEILETYLNRVYFGAGAYGVDAAARRYFGKSADQVTVWEAAVLAGLVKAPSYLSPLNDGSAAEDRAIVVLDTMVGAGLLSPEAHRRAVLTAAPIQPNRSGHAIGGRYFIDWVLDQVQSHLTTIDRDLLIRTTLDRAMQDEADALVKAQLTLRPSTAKAWPGQAALLAMSPDGAVRAMVGGRDYQESQFNRTTQARRQPGSGLQDLHLPGGSGSRLHAGSSNDRRAAAQHRIPTGQLRGPLLRQCQPADRHRKVAEQRRRAAGRTRRLSAGTRNGGAPRHRKPADATPQPRAGH